MNRFFATFVPLLLCLQTHQIIETPSIQDMSFSKPVFSPTSLDAHVVRCLNPTQITTNNEMTFSFAGDRQIQNIYTESSITPLFCDCDGSEGTICLPIDSSVSAVSIFFVFENQQESNYKLYFSHNDNSGSHYSTDLSLDYAKHLAGQDIGYDYQDSSSFEYATSVESLLPQYPGQQTSVIIRGHLMWTDDQEITHPLFGAKIQITTRHLLSDVIVANSYTDELGEYCFNLSYLDNSFWSSSPKLHLFLEGEAIKVALYNGSTYHKVVSLYPNEEGIVDYSDTFHYSNDFGQAAHIFQAGIYYSIEAKKLNDGEPIRKCTFRYPFISKDNPGVTYYDNNNNVYIDASTYSFTPLLNGYAAWDVIGHEYGHHLQKFFDISNNPGGHHNIRYSDIDTQYWAVDPNTYEQLHTLEESKPLAIAMAWGESWPTFWAEIAQSHFPYDIKNINTVNDAVYQSTSVSFWLDVKDYVDNLANRAHGEAGEVDIIRILYKLWSIETDSYDKFSIPEEIIFSIIIENHIKSFHDFVNRLYDAGYNKYELGRLFSCFKITTNHLYEIYDSGSRYLDSLPKFKWSKDSGCLSLPYNEFDLLFFDKYYRSVLKIENIHSDEYTLTSEELATLIRKCGDYYSVSVVSRETSFCQSGSYYSELFEFRLPYYYSNTSYIKPSDWGFEPQYFFTTNKWKQTSTPLTRGALTITHDRLRCGYIENSYIVLSPKRKNAGLAYLTLNFDKPVYSYAFGVAVWSTLVSEGLSSSTCTAKIEALDANGVWREELDLLNDVTLSSRTQQIDKYCTFCSQGIYGLRFIVTAPAVGNNNRGRICIDKILLNTNPDDPYFIDYLYC